MFAVNQKTGLTLAAVLLSMVVSVACGEAVVTYNATNGQLSIDTTGGIGGVGFNLVSVKLPGPQANSIDRWQNNSSQDGIETWIQEFTTNSNNSVTAEQWIALSGANGSSSPNAAVPPGVYQIATYPAGLTESSFIGDAGSQIGVGQIQLGGWSSNAVPGTDEKTTINLVTVGGLACDYLGATGCDISDLNALYAGTNGAPTPLTDASIANWLTQASDVTNPLKASSSHTYVSGDINLDGTVNSTDLGLLLNSFGEVGVGWGQGNLNSDSNVDSTDLGLLLNNFSFTSSAAVPEPSSATMIFFLFALVPLVRGSRSNGTLLR